MPSLPLPSGSCRQVDVDRAGQGVRHHQRRAGEVVRLHVRVDAAFEVAVAATAPPTTTRSLRFDLGGDRLRQRAAVADAGRAAVAGRSGSRAASRYVVQAGLVEVVGDDAAAGRRGSSSRTAWTFRPFSTAFLASRPAAIITRRVAGVRAAGDRGDDDVAVRELGRRVRRPTRDAVAGAARSAPTALGLPSASANAVRNASCTFGSSTRSCGRFGPARLGTTVARSSSSVCV